MQFHRLAFPEHLRRHSKLPEAYRPETYADGFDADTFWYDAIWRKGVVHLVCPPLNNLRALVLGGEFRLDGEPAQIARERRYKRHTVLELAAPRAPDRIDVTLAGWTGETLVHEAGLPGLDGKRVHFCINKDNDLEWIAEHARLTKAGHGLDAVAVIDNGSTRYGTGEIAETLRAVGVEPYVFDAPYRYGPVGLKPYRRTEKYLQTALFNALRLRGLDRAGGILNLDIDEIAIGQGSLFDAARSSKLGFVQIAGEWMSPPPGAEPPFRHEDHIHRFDPPRPSPPKWCLDPSGPLGGFSWDIHGLERLPFLHRFAAKGVWFLHCRGVNTNWKNKGRLKTPENTAPDREAEAAFARLTAKT